MVDRNFRINQTRPISPIVNPSPQIDFDQDHLHLRITFAQLGPHRGRPDLANRPFCYLVVKVMKIYNLFVL